MKKIIFIPAFTLLAFIFCGCQKNSFPGTPVKKYSAEVATAWMKLQIKLTMSTPGFNSVVSNRSFGYAGLVLYESIVPGIEGCNSLLPQLHANAIVTARQGNLYYWPASANAAMAFITKSFFANTSAANKVSIDSLDAAFTAKFQSVATTEQLNNSVGFGQAVAAKIFDWSKTDGAHEINLHVTDSGYIPPIGAGLWIPTPPLFGLAVLPHWGDNRSFVPGIVDASQPPPPISYSEDTKSPFFKMVNELYTISLSLTHQDSITVKFWGDGIPGNLNVPAHATNILIQLIELNKFNLEDAAIAFCKHGVAINDASISVFKTKFQYNLIRPISYIRNVMGHTGWNSVIVTPSFPEYTAAHAVVSAASATVLESIFGKIIHLQIIPTM